MKTLFFIVVSLLFANTNADQLTLKGDFIQGGLVMGKARPGVKVEFEQRIVRVSETGEFIIGFGRDAPPSAVLRITHPDQRIEHHKFKVKKRRYRIQRVDGLPPKTVTPSAKYLERIRLEAKKIRLARQRNDMRTDFLSGFVWPVIGRISGVYGSQRILNGQPRQPHFGVDIAMPVGTPVVSPAPGVVSFVHNMYFSGKTLVVDHGHGLSSSFLHLKRILVKVGQHVVKGQRIAEVGASGRATGAHLDWRMNWFQHRIDPQLLAGPMPK